MAERDSGTPRRGREPVGSDAADAGDAAPATRIRRASAADRDALYRICLLTGDGGDDASGLYHDADILGHVYVGPYAALEPEHAFVLEDAQGVCGYTVGALDTVRFHQRVLERWLPPLRARYPDPAGERSAWTRDQRLAHLLHHPGEEWPLELPADVAPYPSHLHIDLLPRAQGHGQGRALLETLLESLRRDGSPGVHLGVGARNRRAQGFYRHLGFEPLFESHGGQALWFGKRLD